MRLRRGRWRRRTARQASVEARLLRVHPDFHPHLLLVCLAVIFSWGLPGSLVQLGSFGNLYLTFLLGLRLGPLSVRLSRRHARFHPFSIDTHYLLVAIAAVLCQLLWLLSPITLRVSGVPLLCLYTVFIAWSILRLLRVLSVQRRIDGRTLCGAAAGYLLLGISGGLLLTVLDTVMPGGFHDVLSGEILVMPQSTIFNADKIAWDQNFGRLNYFAFVCLTTLGFGDITPVIPATRLACLSLSVLGPLYIAVVLGVLISRLSAAASAPPRGWARPEAPSQPQSGSPPGPPASPPPADRFPAPAPPDRGPGGSGP